VEIWGDLARWFFIGLLLAGVISASIPDTIFERYLGSGLPAMLLMLAIGIPLYICATASTPIAAALILKGVSPGAALVFLLAGPATNITSLTVLTGVLGRRATAIYLTAIAVMSVVLGLALDQVYSITGISARAVAGAAGEVVPVWIKIAATFVLLALSIKPLLGGPSLAPVHRINRIHLRQCLRVRSNLSLLKNVSYCPISKLIRFHRNAGMGHLRSIDLFQQLAELCIFHLPLPITGNLRKIN